jgi:hypothetical protein
MMMLTKLVCFFFSFAEQVKEKEAANQGLEASSSSLIAFSARGLVYAFQERTDGKIVEECG